MSNLFLHTRLCCAAHSTIMFKRVMVRDPAMLTRVAGFKTFCSVPFPNHFHKGIKGPTAGLVFGTLIYIGGRTNPSQV